MSAYCISFNSGSKASGYVLLSLLTYGNPIVEFSYEGHGPNEQVLDGSNAMSGNGLSQSGLLYLGPDCFYVKKNNEIVSMISSSAVDYDTVKKVEGDYKNFVNEAKEMLPAAQATRSASGKSIYDGIIDWRSSYMEPNSVFKIQSFSQGSHYYVMNDFNEGNTDAGICAPTAATNIICYWANDHYRPVAYNPVSNIYGSTAKAKAIFKKVKSAMGTTGSGGTWDTMVPSGYQNYLGNPNSGSRWSYRFLSASSTYNDFKSALSNNCPVHLQLCMDGNPFSSEGHDVFNLGYASSTSGAKYLLVMDGWNRNGRFVKYDYYPVVKGYKIWVS